MNLKEHTIVVYNENDIDSQSLAYFYVFKHNLQNTQIIPINCVSTRILSNYSQFKSQVQDNIVSGINNLDFDPFVIFLSINIPFGFYQGAQIVTSSSRLSKINFTYQLKTQNSLFDRKDIQKLSESDFQQAIICSHISLTNCQDAYRLIQRSSELFDQKYTYGHLFLNNSNSDLIYTKYYEDLILAKQFVLPKTGLMIQQIENYNNQETNVPYLRKDSFFFGYNNVSSSDISGFFKNTDTSRIFFYDWSSNLLQQLALKNGYTSSMINYSIVSDDSFLYANPFFTSLMSDATIGEAYLLSIKYLNWSQSLIGDPLSYVYFRYKIPQISSLELQSPNKSVRQLNSWKNAMRDIQSAIISFYTQNEIILNNLQTVINSQDMSLQIDTVVPYYNISAQHSVKTSSMSRFNKYINLLVQHALQIYKKQLVQKFDITTQITFDNFLKTNNLQVSGILSNLDSRISLIQSNLFLQDGSYQLLYEIQKYDQQTQNYYFDIQISSDVNFSIIINQFTTYSQDTFLDLSSWSYQKQQDIFFDLPTDGVEFGYIGRRILFKNIYQKYSTFYWRIRQKTLSTTYPWNSFYGATLS